MDRKVPLRFMRLPEVMERVGLQTTRIRELESVGQFPKRIKISDRAVGWLEHEIDAWMEERLADRVAVRQSNAAPESEATPRGDGKSEVALPLPSTGKPKTRALVDAGTGTSAEASPYLRMGEVMRLTGMNHAMIYDGVRDKTFPKWVDHSKPGSGWRRKDVEAWLSAREAHTKKRSDG